MKQLVIVLLLFIISVMFVVIAYNHAISRNVLLDRLIYYLVGFIFILTVILIVGFFFLEKDMKYKFIIPIKILGLIIGAGLIFSGFFYAVRSENEKKLLLYIFYFLIMFGIILGLPVIGIGMMYITAIQISCSIIAIAYIGKYYLIKIANHPEMEKELVVFLVFYIMVFIFTISTGYNPFNEKDGGFYIVLTICGFYMFLGLVFKYSLDVVCKWSVERKKIVLYLLCFLIVFRILIWLIWGF